jgi:hypothetical protein
MSVLKLNGEKIFKPMARSSRRVVEHLPQHPKVKGSSPATEIATICLHSLWIRLG